MNAVPTQATPKQKKAYQQPQLKTHGGLRTLTQAGSNKVLNEGPGNGNDGPDRNRP